MKKFERSDDSKFHPCIGFWLRGGGPFCQISLNIKDMFPARVILYVLCHKKTENIFLKFFVVDFLPPQPGVWKIVKTHYTPNKEKHCTEVFDSSNEAFWCADYNAKNLSSLRGPISLKIKNKTPKIGLFEKLSFWENFLDFFQNGTSQRGGFFCVVINASKRFILAIKHPNTMIFIFF